MGESTSLAITRAAISLMAELVAVVLTERDTNGDVMVTWSYPVTEPEQEAVIVARCGLQIAGALIGVSSDSC